MNKVTLIGRLTQKPASYSTTSGKTYCKFTVAVNRDFKSTDGERKADFINCTCFSNQAEYIIKYLDKGSLVGVFGELRTSSYLDDITHKNVYSIDVITSNVEFLDKKKEEPKNNTEVLQEVMEEDPFKITDDDLPF